MNSPSSNVPLDQYDALRSRCGMVELSGWSSVTLTGTDRQTFLNNFCTNDVKRLAPGDRCEAFITNVKGKILGHGLITCRENELAFITVPGQAIEIIGHLERYIIREDVQLHDTTLERAYLLTAGGPTKEARSAKNWIPWELLNIPNCGLVEATPEIMPELMHGLTKSNTVSCGEAAFHALRIEAGTPLFGIDFDASNFPQEVGRNDRAISFTKGCYLGQETVARIDALGHVNQQITGVRFFGKVVPAHGTQLTDAGAAAGHVTSATYSPRLEAPLALAMVRSQWLAPGCGLQSAAGPCEIVALPLPV